MTDQSSKGINENIKTYWPLIVALVMIAVSWGTTNAQREATNQRVTTLENSQSKMLETLTDLRVAAGQLQADVSFIKQRVK